MLWEHIKRGYHRSRDDRYWVQLSNATRKWTLYGDRDGETTALGEFDTLEEAKEKADILDDTWRARKNSYLRLERQLVKMVIGPRIWGKDPTEAGAIKKAAAEMPPTRKLAYYKVYLVHPDTIITQDGRLQYPLDCPPILYKKVENGKEVPISDDD